MHVWAITCESGCLMCSSVRCLQMKVYAPVHKIAHSVLFVCGMCTRTHIKQVHYSDGIGALKACGMGIHGHWIMVHH
jgi:hypothetical protein